MPIKHVPHFHLVPVFNMLPGIDEKSVELVSSCTMEPRWMNSADDLWDGLRKNFPDVKDYSVEASSNPNSYIRLIWKIASGFFWSFDRVSYQMSKCRQRVLIGEQIYTKSTIPSAVSGVLDVFSRGRNSVSRKKEPPSGRVYRSTDHKWVFCEIDMLGNLGFPIFVCRIPAFHE